MTPLICYVRYTSYFLSWFLQEVADQMDENQKDHLSALPATFAGFHFLLIRSRLFYRVTPSLPPPAAYLFPKHTTKCRFCYQSLQGSGEHSDQVGKKVIVMEKLYSNGWIGVDRIHLLFYYKYISHPVPYFLFPPHSLHVVKCLLLH